MAQFSFNSNDLTDKEKLRLFINDLQKYNQMHGKDTVKIPQMGGKELDLYKLFKEVVSRGGSHYVLDNKLWKDVVNALDVPSSCTSASFLLKNHYSKYLLSYEQYYMKNQNKEGNANSQQFKVTQDIPQGVHVQPGNNLEQKFLGKKILRQEDEVQNSVIFRIIKPFMQVKEVKDKAYNKKLRLINAIPDLKRVVLAFESHLSSEIIWAINILLLFSSNINCNLIIENQPYLIESIGNYMYYCMNNITEYFHLFGPTYLGNKKINQQNNKESKAGFNFVNEMNINSTTSLPILSKKDKQLNEKDKLKNDLEVHNYIEEVFEYELAEHLISLLQILRNLSLIRPNEPTIIKNSKVMNIIYVLFTNSRSIEITSNCLDIINNLSKHILLKDAKNGQLILNHVYSYVKSPLKDLSELALECLRKLTFPAGNEEFYDNFDNDFYNEMINLLISPKYDIRECVLEILYCISDQMSSKVKLGKSKYCIERLVGLLCTNSNDNRIAKYSACILSNLAVIPYNQKLIMPYEEQLFLASCVDESLTKTLMGIISN